MQQGIWTKSSRCAADSPQCVEVRHEPTGGINDSGRITVRASTYPELEVSFLPDEWLAFIDGAKNGDFDLPA